MTFREMAADTVIHCAAGDLRLVAALTSRSRPEDRAHTVSSWGACADATASSGKGGHRSAAPTCSSGRGTSVRRGCAVQFVDGLDRGAASDRRRPPLQAGSDQISIARARSVCNRLSRLWCRSNAAAAEASSRAVEGATEANRDFSRQEYDLVMVTTRRPFVPPLPPPIRRCAGLRSISRHPRPITANDRTP